MSQLLVSHVHMALSQQSVATDIKSFMAPLAAVIIGVIGIKYLFGEQRSLAGFIGFLFLGIFVYGFIQFGQSILDSLGNLFRSWLDSDDTSLNFAGHPIFLLFLAVGVLSAVVGVIRAGRRAEDYQDRPPESDIEVEEAVVLPSRAEYAEAALVALMDFAPRDLGAVDRLRNQVRLAVIVAVERGVFDQGSPVTPVHLAKWVVLRDMWPEIVDALWTQPNLLEALENEPLSEFTRSEALFHFLRVGPPLHPVAQHLLYMTPVTEAG